MVDTPGHADFGGEVNLDKLLISQMLNAC